MMHPAVRAEPASRTTSKLPPTVDEAIERYIAATFLRFRRTLRAVIPTFVEPRVSDPDRAMKRMRFLVETLSGFANGAAVGMVAIALRRAVAEPARAAVSTQVARIGKLPGPLGIAVPAGIRFLPDADLRPLVDELGTRLHTRLSRSLPECRAHVAAIHAALGDQLEPAAFVELLETLADDTATAIAFGDHLALGWQHYCASFGARIPDAAGGNRSQRRRDTWRAWTARLGGRAPDAELTHEQVVASGYVMRIG